MPGTQPVRAGFLYPSTKSYRPLRNEGFDIKAFAGEDPAGCFPSKNAFALHMKKSCSPNAAARSAQKCPAGARWRLTQRRRTGTASMEHDRRFTD